VIFEASSFPRAFEAPENCSNAIKSAPRTQPQTLRAFTVASKLNRLGVFPPQFLHLATSCFFPIAAFGAYAEGELSKPVSFLIGASEALVP
jgi:hypothetical protein